MFSKRLATIALSAGLLASSGCSFSYTLFPNLGNRLGVGNNNAAQPCCGTGTVGAAPMMGGYGAGFGCDSHSAPGMDGPFLPGMSGMEGPMMPPSSGMSELPMMPTPRLAPQAVPTPFTPMSAKAKAAE